MPEFPDSHLAFRNQLVSSPVYFPFWPLDQVLQVCAQLGFSKFEAFSEWPDCRLDWHFDPSEPRRLAQSLGLLFTSFHLPVLRENTEEALEEAVAAARFAAGLGVEIVLFKASRKDIYTATAKKFLDALDREGLKLVPVLQNHFRGAIETVEDYKEIFQSVDEDPRLKALLEVGQFQRAGVSWQTAWDYLGERVALIHINEIRDCQSVPYGTGEVDFRGLLRRIKQSGYRGNIVVELELPSRRDDPEETVEGVKSAIAFLEKCYQQV